MAACGFGASGLKIINLDLGCSRPKLSNFQPFHGLRNRKVVQFDNLVLSHRSRKAIIGFQSSAAEEADLPATANLEGDAGELESPNAVNPLIPNAHEVKYLLTALCDTSSIAEFELKLGGFELHVRRDLAKQSAPLPPPSPPPGPAPVTAHSTVAEPASNGSALVLFKSVSSSGEVQTMLDKAADEGLAILQSPRVGYFRRSRAIKGKRAPPSCKEKDTVKEGQVLCYIEQLGGEIPIESDISGEVVSILRKDGDPVGYGDALITILPDFPGIKKLQ